jgi:hypothetical protein
VRRQQRPVDEVANLSTTFDGEGVRGNRECSLDAASCAASGMRHGEFARAQVAQLRRVLQRLNLARRNFINFITSSNPYLFSVSFFLRYNVHGRVVAPHFSYDGDPTIELFNQEKKI